MKLEERFAESVAEARRIADAIETSKNVFNVIDVVKLPQLLRDLAQQCETHILVEQIILDLDPDGEILGNAISDEYRVRTGEIRRCSRCEELIEKGDEPEEKINPDNLCYPCLDLCYPHSNED